MSNTGDVRHLMPPVFDQGRRPTCLAISASDAHQCHVDNVNQLSVEFLYYNSVISSGQTVFNGLVFDEVNAALIEKGQPREMDWPYSKFQPPLKNWNPPETIGECYRGELHPITPNVNSIRASLGKGCPVILGITVRDSLIKFQGAASLKLDCKGEIRGYHAVLAVCYDGNEGGRTCVRNSWGSAWGSNGHVWMNEHYLVANLKYAATIKTLRKVN